jgi:ATP-dependent Clp protease protease subunit
MRIRLMQEELISRHSNKTIAEVTADVERDKILTAAEAVEYGLIDQVLESRKAKPQA